MGSTGKSQAVDTTELMREFEDKISAFDNYDSRFKDDIRNAEKFFMDNFPEIQGYVGNILLDESLATNEPLAIAAVNGVGQLLFNHKWLDYDKLKQRLSEMDVNYLAEQTVEGIFSHERNHVLDLNFMGYIRSKAPDGIGVKRVVKDEEQAERMSKRLGRELKVGDEFEIPRIDSTKPYINFDGKKYSYNDFNDFTSISKRIVETAVKRVTNNWEKFGYNRQPTKTELVQRLSGYASYAKDDAETFAEAMNQYIHRGTIASPLAQEVYKLTKDLYNQMSKRKTNESTNYVNRGYALGLL